MFHKIIAPEVVHDVVKEIPCIDINMSFENRIIDNTVKNLPANNVVTTLNMKKVHKHLRF